MEIILGAGVSILAQLAKKWFGTSEYVTLAVVVGLALGASLSYYFLLAGGYWESTYQILITAGAFYTFIIKRFDK